MELITLGTSCAIPTKNRNLAATMILYEGTQILIDVGEDVQRQFEKASLKFNSPLIILISHLHGDHVIGLPGLLFHFSLIDRDAPTYIFGPPGIFAYLMAHKYLIGLKAPHLEAVYEFDPDPKILIRYDFNSDPKDEKETIKLEENYIIYSGTEFKIKAVPVEHSVPTWGFKIIEHERPGRFNPEKAEELKIPMGPLWHKIQSLGPDESIEIEGRLIYPYKSGVIGDSRPGAIISYSGDTKPTKNLAIIAEDSDVFICESTYKDDLRDVADEKKHMTALQAAQIAAEVNVKLLVLTHISTRYGSDEISDILKEAKAVFPNTILAEDLMRIPINRRQE